MATSEERLSWGPLQNPVRGLLHGSAALVWAGLAIGLASSRTFASEAGPAVLIFALTQLSLFATSALYHSAPWNPLAKARMRRLDHAMIYVKIAGMHTPVMWLGLDGTERLLLLGTAWLIALLGVIQKLGFPSWIGSSSWILQVLQAALVIPALPTFAARFPGAPVFLVGLGAAFYVAGMLAYLTQRPKLWPRVFSYHEVFHVLLLAGSATWYSLVVNHLA